MNRPEIDEYAPYYNTYISLVQGDDVLNIIESQPQRLNSIFEGMDESRGIHQYSEGKWTIKELLSHIIDGERIFAYRVLRISRGDQTPIEGFEQDGYIENSNANGRSFSDLLKEFELTRQANMLMFRSMTPDAESRLGTASENTVSVRALTYIMAGHVEHHIRILQDRYLS
jgi:exoribonuclease II